MSLKYSVIVPAFNASRTIKRCIDSIVDAGRNHDIEIILINDGSTDQTKDICEEYSLRHPWILFFSQENGGVAAARNRALQLSTGDYIAFVDSDDTVDNNYFDFLDEKIKRTNADIIVFGLRRILIDGSVLNRPNTRKSLSKVDLMRVQLQVSLFKNVVLYIGARIISRKVIPKTGFNKDIKLGSDTIFNILCLNNSVNVEIFPDIIYSYYEGENSITSSKFKPNLLASVEAHYNGRLKAHIWPDSYDDRDALIKDLSISYIEGMLPYLINNLKYGPISEVKREIVRIRKSFVYQDCIRNYTGSHKSPFMKAIIFLFIKGNVAMMATILSVRWRIERICKLKSTDTRKLSK